MGEATITPFLWFTSGAEEAARAYVALFGGRIVDETRSPGGVMTVTFEIGGLRITALNGGPRYALSPAFSLVYPCDTQAEIDRVWDALIADGGQESRCGWLVDRFGVSWQVVPRGLGKLLSGPDAAAAQRTAQALLAMNKLDLAALEAANRG